ncbi:hypothetical protein [Rasiella sp. SM2506]|uniref:hypothetical protein n=1 Tax=Rasiella sp. SM2506 TaxID=3423914 RepID=UPI003D7BDE90
MKKYNILLMVILLLGAIQLSNAQVGEVVDFGDSGIEVVVEQKGEGMKTGWVYWFPFDEWGKFPPMVLVPPIFNPPWNGGGGGARPNEPDCQWLTNEIIDLTVYIESFENTLQDWDRNGFATDPQGNTFPKGSTGYNNLVKQKQEKVNDWKKQRENASDAINDGC